MNATTDERVVKRACHLCEAICGLDIHLAGERIVAIRGDRDDAFSRGHICPKAVALQDIHDDPDRIRTPLWREGSRWLPLDWDEAFERAAEGIAAVAAVHGNDAVGLYAGNPSVHNLGTLLAVPGLVKLVKSRNLYSATSVDQLPQQLVSYLMFGHQFLIPIPDIDRTRHFLIIGANPIASNGSMMTVPDVAKRLKAVRARGGKVVVIDPRRTETAEAADEHHFIRPGTDALLLMAILNVVVKACGTNALSLSGRLRGLDDALRAIAGVTPGVAAAATGIDAATIERLAREFAAAPAAVAYGRLGTTLQTFGAVNQWLLYLLNIVTGNLDREGGALFTHPLLPVTGPGTRPGGHARWRSRVRDLPETGGELPVATLADEMLTPGPGQIRSLITIAGNPALSTPNGTRLENALAGLDFMVSIDIALNETTRFARLILPPTSSLYHDHYDLIFNAFAVRNVARLNPPIGPRPAGERYDWEIFGGLGTRLAAKLGRDFAAPAPTAEWLAAALAKTGDDREALAAAPSGIDLGPLRPSLATRLETADGMIDCFPAAIAADLPRVKAAATQPPPVLSLIGRRHVRSNNSWMHNSHRLVKGKARHQLLMHPDDLAERGIVPGQRVEIRSRVGSAIVEAEADAAMMRGVVSLPHGFGHHRLGIRAAIAAEHAGVSANDLTDDRSLDAVSGNAALNGVPVTVSPAS